MYLYYHKPSNTPAAKDHASRARVHQKALGVPLSTLADG